MAMRRRRAALFWIPYTAYIDGEKHAHDSTEVFETVLPASAPVVPPEVVQPYGELANDSLLHQDTAVEPEQRQASSSDANPGDQ